MPDINGIPYVESDDLVSAYPAASQALAQEVSDQLASKLDATAPVGKVLQVVYATSTTTTAISTSTMTDTTLSATITPSSATSKVLVVVDQSVQLGGASGSMGGAIRVVRDATVISSDDTYQTIYNSGFSGTFTLANRVGYSILDTPASTSAITYKTQGRREAASGTLTCQYGASQSQIVLMEIAA